MRFTATCILLGSMVLLLGCSNSSDEIDDLRAQLDSANAELAQLKASQEDVITNTTNNEISGEKTSPRVSEVVRGKLESILKLAHMYPEEMKMFHLITLSVLGNGSVVLGGTISETITAGLTDGNAIVDIEPDDIGFTSIGCEEWVRR